MARPKGQKLSQELISEIRTLAIQGHTQQEIIRLLKCSQYAVARYSKGINQKTISDERREEVIELLATTDYTAKRIGELTGVSARSVSYINSRFHVRPSKELRETFAINRQVPERDKSKRYEIILFDIDGRPGEEASRIIDHVPCYWDFANLCSVTGINADDFETECSSNIRDKLCYGVVYDIGMKVIARYVIERIVGDASDYNDFWDGMDKDYYDK